MVTSYYNFVDGFWGAQVHKPVSPLNLNIFKSKSKKENERNWSSLNNNWKKEMCGIFAYLNYGVNRERRYILQVLFNGLRRLEYRGYDSAGICIDDSSSPSPLPSPSSSVNGCPPLVFRQEGNIESLVKSVYEGLQILHLLSIYLT